MGVLTLGAAAADVDSNIMNQNSATSF